MDLCQLRLGDVGANVDGSEIGDLVQRLTGLDDLTGSGIRRQHGAGAGISDLALADPFIDSGHLCVDRRHLFGRRLSLGSCGVDLLAVRSDLMLLRRDLFVLRLQLLFEHAIVALRLVELLRRCRLLIEQSPHALVGAFGHVVLCLEHGLLSLCRIALSSSRLALRGQDINLPGDFVHP